MKIAKIGCLLLAVLFILTACGGSSSNKTSSDQDASYSMLECQFHIPYLDATGLPSNYSDKRNKTIKDAYDLINNGERMAVSKEKGTLKGTYYAVSKYSIDDYFYYGDVKDDKPHGFGVLIARMPSMTYNSTEETQQIQYIGSFSKGKFDGYGALFTTSPEFNPFYSSFITEDLGVRMSDKEISALNLYSMNHVLYDGEWKDGKRNGKGNEYRLPGDYSEDEFMNRGVVDWLTDGLPAEMIKHIPEDYWAYLLYPEYYYTGEFKKDEASGQGKMYHYHDIEYDGKMKRGAPADTTKINKNHDATLSNVYSKLASNVKAETESDESVAPEEEPYTEDTSSMTNEDTSYSGDNTSPGMDEDDTHTMIHYMIGDYINAYVEDLNNREYDKLSKTVKPGSNMESMQKAYMSKASVSEELVGYNVDNIEKIDATTYYATVTEEYIIYQDKEPYSFYLKQRCTYNVNVGQYVMITDFVGTVEVLDKQEL